MTAQQLKNSILQLAVQGKLVPQDPNDEPASVLLERIRAEKEALIKAKKIKREKNPSVIFRGADNTPYEKIGDDVRSLADYAPFEIHETWEWCRVGDLFTNMSGLAYKKEVLDIKSERMIRVMRGGNIGDERYYFKADDVFISDEFVKPELFLKKNYMITPAVSSLEHIGKIALIEEDLADTVVGGFVLMLIPLFSDDIISKYLLYAFAAKNHRDNCRSITHKSGQAFYNLSRELMMNLPIPLPPRSEMERIISKLEEVLPFVDSYSIAERESTALNTSFPEQLKKSILQWAVQGKLVPQDPSDEPAAALLERIRGEKERLVREGKIKKDKHESVIFRRDNSHYEKRGVDTVCIDDALPFDIPETWCWTRLSSIAIKEVKRGKSPQYAENGSVYVFAQKCNVKSGGINMSLAKYLAPSAFSKYPAEEQMLDRDIIVNSTGGGTLGRIGIFHDSDRINDCPIVPDSHVTIVRTSCEFAEDYIFYVFKYYQPYLEALGEGSTNQTELKPSVIADLFVPVPPLSEQKRIVKALARVLDQLSLL